MEMPSDGFACTTVGAKAIRVAAAVRPASNDRTPRIM
jgi:hypothetical protein